MEEVEVCRAGSVYSAASLGATTGPVYHIARGPANSANSPVGARDSNNLWEFSIILR
jgi:hypothetical protein